MDKMRDDDKTSRGRRRGSSGRGDHYAILEDKHEQSRLEYSDDGFEREGLLCDHGVGDRGDVRGGGHSGGGGDGLKGSKGDGEKVEDDAAENITSVVKTRKSCGEDQQRRPDSLDVQNTHSGTERRGKVEDTGGVEGLARSLDYVEGIEDLENVEALDCIDGFDFIDSFVVVDSGNNTKSVRGSAANPSALLRHREDRQPKSDHATPAASQARASDRNDLNRAEVRSRPPQDNFCWKSQGHAEGKEARGAVMRRCQPRNGHCVSCKQHQSSSRGERRYVDLQLVSKLGREGQKRMVKQLTRENELLRRRITGFQLALKLSAEDDITASSSFSAAPPAFPRGGGQPAPSPRVDRGWTHQHSSARLSPSIEGDLSIKSPLILRQLKAARRQAWALQQAKQALVAQANELESGGVLRITRTRLAKREEEIASLREELGVMQRLARAQDRKFEGFEGYAMAHRLWAVEEELRLARSTAASSVAELARLRETQNTQRQTFSRRRCGKSSGEGTRIRSRRPVMRRLLSPDKARRAEQQNPKISCSVDPKQSGWTEMVEKGGGEGTLSRGLRTARKSTTIQEEEKIERGALETKVYLLQRALANMRRKAQEELRKAHAANDRLKNEKDALGRDLEAKAKETRVQLRKVNLLKRQLRQLSAGAEKLGRASFAVSSPDVSLETRAMASVVAGVGSLETEPFFAEDESQRGSAIETRRASTAPMIIAQPSPKSTRGRENSQRCGNPTRVNNTHASAASINAASNIAVAVGGETTGRVGSARQSGAEEDQIGRSRKGDAPREASVRAGTEAFQAKSAASSGSEMERLSPRVKNTDRHPCPLSGILDMLEPPLRRDRRASSPTMGVFTRQYRLEKGAYCLRSPYGKTNRWTASWIPRELSVTARIVSWEAWSRQRD
ncbi:unnamed protein product [Ascophyllum nodosum]